MKESNNVELNFLIWRRVFDCDGSGGGMIL